MAGGGGWWRPENRFLKGGGGWWRVVASGGGWWRVVESFIRCLFVKSKKFFRVFDIVKECK